MKRKINHQLYPAVNAELNAVHLSNSSNRKIAGTIAFKVGRAMHWLSHHLSPIQKRRLILSVMVLLSCFFIFILLQGFALQEHKLENKPRQSLPTNPSKQKE